MRPYIPRKLNLLRTSTAYPKHSRSIFASLKPISRAHQSQFINSNSYELLPSQRSFGTLDYQEPFVWDHDTHWNDPCQLDSTLTEEELLIKQSTKQFVDSNLRPRVKDHFRYEGDSSGDIEKSYQITRDIIKEMGQAGLLGTVLPEKYGCAGASTTAYGLVAREIERCDSGYRSTASVQSSLVMWPIYCFGSEEQKLKYIPRLATGDIIGCFGLSEPNGGSDAGGMLSNAKKEDNNLDSDSDYILSGSKTWITNSPIADVVLVWAKDMSDGGKIRGFLLDRTDLPNKELAGLSTPKIDGKFSLRASPTGMILMDGVRVPKKNVLPLVSSMKGPFSCLNSARLGIAWGALGCAEECLSITRDYVIERKLFNRPLASNQLIQKKLADSLTEITTGLLLAARISRMKESTMMHSNLVSMAKRNSCGKALTIARDCRDMLGGNGIHDEYHIIRHCLNLESVNTYEGTHDVHALILGRSITGLSAF